MKLKSSNDINVFIVEDDATQAELLLEKLLEFNASYAIVKFENGTDLLDYFKNGHQKTKHNYIILDYFLQTPGEKSGLSGLDIIKQLGILNKKAKIIVYSAYETDDEENLKDLADEFNVIEFVKKSTHSYSSIQNIIRFDFAKITLNRKKIKFHIALGIFLFLLAISGLHFLISYF